MSASSSGELFGEASLTWRSLGRFLFRPDHANLTPRLKFLRHHGHHVESTRLVENPRQGDGQNRKLTWQRYLASAYGTMALAASHAAISQVSRCISYDCSWRHGLNSDL